MKTIWGGNNIRWVTLSANGTAGGIFFLWDSSRVEYEDHWTGVFSVSVLLEDRDNHKECIISSVYGPNSNQRKTEFWNELDTIKIRWNKLWCIGGDFNVGCVGVVFLE